MSSPKVYISIALPLLALILFLVTRPHIPTVPIEKHKGICWVGQPNEISTQEITAAVYNGVTWISQTPFAWQRTANDTAIHFETSTQKIWWGESKEGLTTTTKLAHAAGIKTILKPHIWVRESWPGEIEMKSEADWQRWFQQYTKFILYYATLAEEENIEILCIGTELHKTIKQPAWRDLIKKIKAIYKGKLTYAANFDGEFESVPFWDELDYIGIQGYFPLTKNENPTVEELIVGWKQPIRSMEAIHRKFKKPILLTELGYKSTTDAGIEPWRWPERNEPNISDQTQARCYQAFFQTVWPLPWLEGVYFWKWYPHPPKNLVLGDFTPQGKPAEKIMKEWFTKP